MAGSTQAAGARPLHICFFFNAQRHQLLHGISTAVALARRPGYRVSVLSPSHGHVRYAQALAARLGDAPIDYEVADSALLEALRRMTGGAVPPKLLTLAALARRLDRFDAIALPERTSIILRSAGVRRPSFIHLDHGAGDRAAGFDRRIRRFDYVLMAGPKHRRRLLREGLIREGAHAMVGYPKFEAADAAREPGWTPFPGDDRPVILYNPHFSPLGSWEKMGAALVGAFARQDRYNLIVAPHVRLFDGKLAQAKWRALLDEHADNPRIYIDTGSDRSIDMTYTTMADVYVGDVSSQVYEYLRTPRPCLFLDAHGIAWQDDENYGHWHFGPVLRDAGAIVEAVDAARAGHAAYRPIQEQGFADTFEVPGAPPGDSASERAAGMIADHMAVRRHRIERRHADRQGRQQARRTRIGDVARRAAVILPAMFGGWLVHDLLEPSPTIAAPTFVDEAAQSLPVLLIRDEMRSQLNTPDFDADEIRRATSVVMPRLPAGWQILDVQIFPSDFGPSVQTLLRTPSGERLALVGMRIETPAEQQPLLDRRRDEQVAYWEEGELAFALVGRIPSKRLLEYASEFSRLS